MGCIPQGAKGCCVEAESEGRCEEGCTETEDQEDGGEGSGGGTGPGNHLTGVFRRPVPLQERYALSSMVTIHSPIPCELSDENYPFAVRITSDSNIPVEASWSSIGASLILQQMN